MARSWRHDRAEICAVFQGSLFVWDLLCASSMGPALPRLFFEDEEGEEGSPAGPILREVMHAISGEVPVAPSASGVQRISVDRRRHNDRDTDVDPMERVAVLHAPDETNGSHEPRDDIGRLFAAELDRAFREARRVKIGASARGPSLAPHRRETAPTRDDPKREDLYVVHVAVPGESASPPSKAERPPATSSRTRRALALVLLLLLVIVGVWVTRHGTSPAVSVVLAWWKGLDPATLL